MPRGMRYRRPSRRSGWPSGSRRASGARAARSAAGRAARSRGAGAARVRAGAQGQCRGRGARRWVADLVRRGLADAQRESWRLLGRAGRAHGRRAGARARLARPAASPGARAGDDVGRERVLEEAALLQLLLEAHGRLDSLPEATRADVRQLIGWTVPTERGAVRRARARRVGVSARRRCEDDRLRTQRTWLCGTGAGTLR